LGRGRLLAGGNENVASIFGLLLSLYHQKREQPDIILTA